MFHPTRSHGAEGAPGIIWVLEGSLEVLACCIDFDDVKSIIKKQTLGLQSDSATILFILCPLSILVLALKVKTHVLQNK